MAPPLTTEHKQTVEREGVEIEVTVECPWHREGRHWEPGEVTAYDAKKQTVHLTKHETDDALDRAVVERDRQIFP